MFSDDLLEFRKDVLEALTGTDKPSIVFTGLTAQHKKAV